MNREFIEIYFIHFDVDIIGMFIEKNTRTIYTFPVRVDTEDKLHASIQIKYVNPAKKSINVTGKIVGI